MEKEKKIQKGQIVFVKSAKFSSQSWDKKDIEKWLITKLGRKYIYAKPENGFSYDVQFEWNPHLEVWQDTSDPIVYYLYATKEEVDMVLKMEKYKTILSDFFGSAGFEQKLTMDQMEKIIAIVKGGTDNEK